MSHHWRPSVVTLLVATLATLTAAGCADHTTAPMSGRIRTPGLLQHDIFDAAHGGGKHGYYFLPPMVAQPSYAGTFDGALSPDVQVCVWTPSGCGALVADFTTTSGTGGRTVSVDPAAQQYQVNWDTQVCSSGPCTLDPTRTYRIRTLVGGVELGHADVQLVNNGAGLKNIQTNDYIGLVDGRTLPVKFRAESGIVGAVTVAPPGATIHPTQTQVFAATVIDLHGNVLIGRITTWSSAATAVATVDGAGLATATGIGTTTITVAVEGEHGSASLSVTAAGPTGTIVVLSTRLGLWALDKMNADGSNVHQVTSFVPQDDQPTPDLSPDRNTVVFASGSQVWKADVATGTVTQLTFFGAYTRYPKWSPDGQKIAFNSLGNNGFNLYVMNPDGTGVQQITNDPADEITPTWSPDSKRLAFLDDRTGTLQLFVLDIASGVERQVTFDPGTHLSPRWSPTGSLVAYMKDNTIWVVDVDDGLPPRQLTSPGATESEPAFSPDGSQLIFESTRVSGHFQLWSVNLDGSNLHLFNATSYDVRSPVWR